MTPARGGSRRGGRAARLVRRLAPVALVIAYLTYLIANAPGASRGPDRGGVEFAVDVTGTDDAGPTDVLLARTPTLEISSLTDRRPAAVLSVGLQAAGTAPRPVHVTAQLPGHAVVTALAWRTPGTPDRRVAVPEGFAGDLGTPLGTVVVRYSVDPATLDRVWVVRVPATVDPGGTLVEIAASTDAAALTGDGPLVGVHHARVVFGGTDLVPMARLDRLPPAETFHGSGRALRVGLGGLRLRETSIVTDPDGTQADAVAWTRPYGASSEAIRADFTVEDGATRSVASMVEIVITLLLGAWLGVAADRLLAGTGHRPPRRWWWWRGAPASGAADQRRAG